MKLSIVVLFLLLFVGSSCSNNHSVGINKDSNGKIKIAYKTRFARSASARSKYGKILFYTENDNKKYKKERSSLVESIINDNELLITHKDDLFEMIKIKDASVKLVQKYSRNSL